MRLEEFEDIRERLEDEKKAVEKANGRHPYNPEKPWDYVWHTAVADSERFWKDEFETPASMVKLRLRKLADEVDGDAEVKPTTASSSNHPHEDSGAIARSSGPRPWQQVPTPPPPVRALAAIAPLPSRETAKRAQEDGGLRSRNGKGHPLCDGFQDGSCVDCLPGGVVCAGDRRSRHQCARCLSTDHGASDPTCPLRPKAAKAAASDRGRGRGRRRGRGRGRQ